MTALWKFLLIGLAVYALLVAMIYVRQESMIFFPDMPGRQLIATPGQIGLAFEDINFTTDDAVKLHGWFISAEEPLGTLLFFHGNAGNISHRLESIEIFNSLGLNVFIIDYRGYGKSEGKISENGTYRDADAAWRYLTEDRGVNADTIIIFGRSLGSAIATWLASQRDAAGLIIESGFSSVPSMAQRLYPFLPVRLLSSFDYDTESNVSNVNSPVLVIHSKTDEIIPYEEGRRVFDSAPPDRRSFLDINGGHNDGFLLSRETYVKGLENFLSVSLQQSAGQ